MKSNSDSPLAGRWGTGLVIAIVGVSALAVSLSCLGLCGGILFLSRTKIQSAAERAGLDIRAVVPEPPTDWNDWMVRRELTHLYQTALESVDTDAAVLEKLGEPLEAVGNTDELFRRQNKGALNPQGEQIEFDVQGPKGVGKVAVISTPKQPEGVQPEYITVTLTDAHTINVRPLHRPLPPVR